MLTKVEGNGLIGAAGYYHILGIPHWLTNEFVIPNNFTFKFRWCLQCTYRTITDRAHCYFSTIKEKAHSDCLPISEFTSIVIIKA
jgi:hypothetical protein